MGEQTRLKALVDEMQLVRTTNPDGEEIACFECGAEFGKHLPFEQRGCPDCTASVQDLFDQRDVADYLEADEIIADAEGDRGGDGSDDRDETAAVQEVDAE